MKRFTKLYTTLDQTTKTSLKVTALAEYFAEAPPADAAWAIHFLSGNKLRRLIPTKLLRQWSAAAAGIETWMFEECYEIVGDLAEVMALILPPPTQQSDLSLEHWVTERMPSLRSMAENEQRETIENWWNELDEQARFVFHKLITGSFRVGVSRKLVVKGLSKQSQIPPEVLAHRLMGNWEPSAESYLALLNPDTHDAHVSQPYPFYLAHPLEKEAESLGDLDEWQAEWKWDGIRAQILKREGQVFIWSRGEDLMTERFPELIATAQMLPDGVVLDGEIVAWKDDAILPFSEMQRRIGRKKVGKKILSDVPVSFIAFDLLEQDGRDVRAESLDWRRGKLEHVFYELNDNFWNDVAVASSHSDPLQLRLEATATTTSSDSKEEHAAQQKLFNTFQLSEILPASTWLDLEELRQESRAHQTEGLMLKRRSGPYQVGRPRGDWWKWKIEPYTVDAVLIYAQRGHGRRASLYTDYTFAVWDNDQLVPFAKAYSGLTDAEIRKVDRYVRQNTLERYGPVRSVTPKLVFELAFENIQESKRHKSGIAVRFPRISRWREDLAIDDADSLDTIKSMMNATRQHQV